MICNMRKAEPKKPWNAGKLVGPKKKLSPEEVRAIEYHLGREGKVRDLALFRLAIDSMLRGCDLVRLKSVDVAPGGKAADRLTRA